MTTLTESLTAIFNFFNHVFKVEQITRAELYQQHPGYLHANLIANFFINTSCLLGLLGFAYNTLREDRRRWRSAFFAYGGFLFLCTLARAFCIVTIWLPLVRVEILLNMLTAIASVIVTYIFFPIIPGIVRLKTLKAAAAEKDFLKQEVTESRALEEQLRLYERILNSSAEGVVLTRCSDWRMVYANPMFEKILGYEPGELIGSHISKVNAKTDLSPDETAARIVECLEMEKKWRGEILNLRKDGTTVLCQVGVTTMEQSPYGKVWVSIHWDLTETKETERRLKEQEAKAASAAKMAALGEMAAGIGHEINNPLSIIQATAEDLLDNMENGTAPETALIAERPEKNRDHLVSNFQNH